MNGLRTSNKRAVRIASPVLVAAAVATVLWVSAGDLNPPSGTIQPTNRVQLNEQVISLPYTITQSGSYVLTSNLTGSSGSDGIIIDADDVTLDLNGFALQGVAGSLDGIRVAGTYRNTTIRNGTISGWDGDGVDASSGINGRFEALSIDSSGADGLRVGSNSSARDLSISGSGATGIHVGGVRNRIEANHVAQNYIGIEVDDIDNLIVKNSAVENAAQDFWISAGNAYGPIVQVGGVGDISVVANSDHPWANFVVTCPRLTWCVDGDGDTYGDYTNFVQACLQPEGYVGEARCTDCNDADSSVNPDATEICDDGMDNDCNGMADCADWLSLCTRDEDSDGHMPPPCGSDCNDRQPDIYPGATEICNDFRDNDCDTLIDCSDPDCEIDIDGDGFFALPCGTDCDDNRGDVFPGNPELCDGLDNDCDTVVDEGNPGGGGICSTGLPGVCANGRLWCQGGSLVCQPDVPSSPEVCDGLDNDCDGPVDEAACPNSTVCVNGAICQSTWCIDGYCCESSCGNPCYACDITPGACTVVPHGQPSHPPQACPGGECDGTGVCCRVPGTPCSTGQNCCSDSCVNIPFVGYVCQ